MDNSKRVAVLGLGYVGCVTAAGLARLGHRVLGIDRDSHKVDQVLAGRAPFFEPGLEEWVRDGVASGCLTASTSPEGLADVDIALVAVGTPSEKNGDLALGQLRRAVEEIAEARVGTDEALIVAIRSTVFPGTCEDVVIPALRRCPEIRVVSNPEFLREGAAVKDFLEPSLLVVGGDDPGAVATVAELYESLGVHPCRVSLRTAELIKYACNAFHAVKISFANEIGALAETLDIDGHEVMQTLCEDRKLNIAPAYLSPGFAFGGSCLPKDLRALNYRAARMDLHLPLLSSAMPSNDRHLHRAVDAILDLPARRIGVIGLAFKEDTDDLRESPVVGLLEHLIGKGRDVRVYDPQISLAAIYGSNRNFLLQAIPHIGRLLDGLDQVLAWSEYLVVAQKQDAATMERIRESGIPCVRLMDGSLRPTCDTPAGVGAAT